MSAILPKLLVKHALTKVGLREKGGANKGADLQEFFDADSYDPNGAKPGDDGYAWCAAFICRIVQLAIQDSGRTFSFNRPTTPGAWAFEAWSRAQDSSTKTRKPPRTEVDGPVVHAGDICVLKISHICLAVSDSDSDGYLWTVEGNTNSAGSREGDGVYKKKRHISQFRSTIRFTV